MQLIGSRVKVSAFRSVIVLFGATWFLQISVGILEIVTPLALQSMGLKADSVGFIAALHAAGFMAGAIYAPQFMARVGNIRCFSAAAAICGIGSLTLFLMQDAWSWSIIRTLQGFGFALMFTSAEAVDGRGH